jgi:hypothetical protein
MNPGLTQGFVKFNTVGCHVLRYLHAHGPSLAADIRRSGTHVEAQQISATLIRLRSLGYVFLVGRDRKPGKRSYPLFDVEPRNNGMLYVPIMTATERQKRYRDRRKAMVSSVFDWRGQIPLR